MPFTFAFCGLWQFMHVCAAGTVACGDSKTRVVAVRAVQPELADVLLVAERHRLLRLYPTRV